MKTYKKLSMTIQAKVWNDVLQEEDIKFLEEVEVMTHTLLSQVYVFIGLLEQYIDLVEGSSIFAVKQEDSENGDMSDIPTQTAGASANRAERRAEVKPKNRPEPKIRKTPFEAVKK